MNSKDMPPIFVADSPGLDFLNSIATPVDVPVEWIGDGEGLLSWLEQAGLLPASALVVLRESATPAELDDIAGQARNLREWFRGFIDDRKGRPLTADDLSDLKPLNRLLRRDESFVQIVTRDDDGPRQLELQVSRLWRTPESALQPIATALAQLVCEEDFTHIKNCEGHACTLMFVDRTRARARRWCSMAICGNRAKQAAHRHRRRN
ncbi:ABATE domain-containing protein [Methylobacterium sp. 092160098-2]|uniref:CGNR zinc finger domain-containing protein n=1 Tax=Methylobacterium sp. 092160098-2 TaxID=3025129 RepID=UPI002381977E|nr:ABATE domain-containing protein [Methylobacterium sp. 092160098-2]MDE4915140.1 ABATE domain-containing protein [Methylobacterium sp. 092160098-2]